MDPFLAVILVGLPLAWLVAFAAYAYVDAPNHGMNPTKWAAISLVVPLFGFFAYLFEREERDYDPSDDPYAQGVAFEVHESRRGEGLLGADRTDREADDGGRGTGGDRSDDGGSDADDEWDDPPGVDL
jgi:hypothetical protein